MSKTIYNADYSECLPEARAARDVVMPDIPRGPASGYGLAPAQPGADVGKLVLHGRNGGARLAGT